MSRKPITQFKPLYIGEWLARRRRQPRDVSDKIGITEGYMSELISGKKKNPSTRILFALAEELGLQLQDLYQRPPSEAALKNVEQLSASDQATLSRLIEKVKGKL